MLALSRSDNRKQSESDSPRFALNTVWKDGGSTNGWNALLCKSFLKPIIFDGVPRTQDHSLCWASFFESTLILPLNICLDKSTVKSIKKKNWRLLSGFDLEPIDDLPQKKHLSVRSFKFDFLSSSVEKSFRVRLQAGAAMHFAPCGRDFALRISALDLNFTVTHGLEEEDTLQSCGISGGPAM